jgi:DNA-binding NtrC family response regulator
MRMPGMDGIQFLSRIKALSPDTVRVMLTGNTEIETAINAINEGSIFRFLKKPCSKELMAKTLKSTPRPHAAENRRDMLFIPESKSIRSYQHR